MEDYTVLLLRPDSMWDGHQSDWVLREHVQADSVDQAFGRAQDAAIKLDAYEGEPEDYAVLAVYCGELFDQFVA